MKTFEAKLISSALLSVIITLHWGYQTAANDFSYDDDDDQVTSQDIENKINQLSLENKAMLSEANAELTEAIENNLIRLLAVVSTQTSRKPRQDDDDEDLTSVVTPNPNVLPQVAQILSVIFGGGLNISRVVTQTYGLVPNVLRQQVGGLVQLLSQDASRNSTNKAPAANSTASTPKTKSKRKYVRKLSNTQVEKLEDDIIRAAIEYEPIARQRDPRGVLEEFVQIMGGVNLNSTEVVSQVPSLFAGAMGAVATLNRLGLLEPITDFIQYELEFLGVLD